MIQDDKLQLRQIASRFLAVFEEAGATLVEAPTLLPADTLLDLYGEDIRARTYVTDDPLYGEMILRPDFTVPVALWHMQNGGGAARYTYMGEVFRKQEHSGTRDHENVQVGFEIFDHDKPEKADADIFSLFFEALSPIGLKVATGDIGILVAALDSLSTSDRRKKALLRHLWRPKRFRNLLARFGKTTQNIPTRKHLLDQIQNKGIDALLDEAGPVFGVRSRDEIRERLVVLVEDSLLPPLTSGEMDILRHIIELRETLPYALEHLRDISVDMPGMLPAVKRFEDRIDALAQRGMDVASLEFEASYGRTTLEYYDGFVFGFYTPGRPDLTPIASGGRYDALTAVLGRGQKLSAIGGIIRPENILRLNGELS